LRDETPQEVRDTKGKEGKGDRKGEKREEE